MVADTKKVQSLINLAAVEVQAIRAAVASLQAIRGRYQAASPSLSGTPLTAADVAAISSGINALATAAGAAVFDKVVAAVVPSHEGKALD